MAIVLDAMGGDHAPEAVVLGAMEAASDGIEIVLVGQTVEIEKYLKPHPNIEVVHADEVVTMCDSPAEAFRKKTNSSIAIGLKIAKERQLPFVSAGNTGACMAGALFSFGRISGIKRPPIASIFPQMGGGHAIVLDVGANVDCDSENLLNFAVVGAAYARAMFGIEDPAVGLLSNGEEEAKGNSLVLNTHALLKESALNFIGNVEGFDVLTGRCDVIVTDGFVGNVLLKTTEGVAMMFGKLIKKGLSGLKEFPESVQHMIQSMKIFDPENPEHCGAPLLGINGYCYIAHGGASAKVIRGACQTSEKLGKSGIVDLISEGLKGVTK
jgi:glycerol-3-phosphate acyltransferase PlsX